jgi:RHS repeat-associated protein
MLNSMAIRSATAFSCLTILVFTCFANASDPTPVYSEQLSPGENTELTFHRTVNLGTNVPGKYVLRIQNGSYGPQLNAQCDALTDASAKRSCQFTNQQNALLAQETRLEWLKLKINNVALQALGVTKPVADPKVLLKGQGFIEQVITLSQNSNQVDITLLGNPLAGAFVKLDILPALTNLSPYAIFTISPMSGVRPLTISLDGRGSFDPEAGPLTYSWTVDGGVVGTTPTLKLVITSAGDHPVSLTVTDNAGIANTLSTSVFVRDPAPPVNPPPNKRPVPILTVHEADPSNPLKWSFSGLGSFDPDGLVTKYQFVISDGTTLNPSGPFTTYTFKREGTYLVKLNVTDDQGAVSSKEESISVRSVTQLDPGPLVFQKTYNGSFAGAVKTTDLISIGTGTTVGSPNSPPTTSLDPGDYQLTVINSNGIDYGTLVCPTDLWQKVICNLENVQAKYHLTFFRMDSVTVVLDGKRLTDSQSVTKTNAIFQTIVSVHDKSKLDVTVSGYPTAYASLEIRKLVPRAGPPLVDFNYSTSGAIPQTIQFQALKYNQNASPTTYQWSFGQGVTSGSSINPLAQAVYASAGSYTVTLTATDSTGAVVQVTKQINVALDTLPDIVIDAEPRQGQAPLAVDFNANATIASAGDSLTSFQWTFDDGSSATGAIVRHVFTQKGEHLATLLVSDSKNGVSQKSVVIFVNQGIAPVASFSSSQVMGTVPLTISFDGGASFDRVHGGDVAQYIWDFGDGSAIANGKTTSHTYTAPGTYDVQLKVFDAAGSGNVAVQRVVVAPSLPPIAVANASVLNGVAPQLITFNALGSFDPEGAPLVSYEWAFSDGTFDQGISVTHTFTVAGSYQATLRVRDIAGLYSIPAILNITITQNLPPIASFTANVSAGLGVLSAAFDASSSTDPDGQIAAYFWDFGDGMQSSGVTTSHIYTTPGQFNVALTVTDNRGAQTTLSKSITVRDTQAPVIQLASPINGTLYKTLTIPVSGQSNEPLASALANGQPLTLSNDKLSFSGNFKTTSNGSLTINLVASDLAGNQSAVSATIQVNSDLGNLPPDPATVAPALAMGSTTSLYDSTSFLFTGASPIQTGVTQGAIVPILAGAVRGQVFDQNAVALYGVKISLLNHAEIGQTLSREDGMFDLAVNGGSTFQIKYEKAGYLSVQRKLNAISGNYTTIDPVTMIPIDPKVTMVNMGSSSMQVAQGSTVTDSAGTRTSSILIPAGVTAKIILPSGQSITAPSLSLRFTEFTVGDSGASRMPADLPPRTAYTYAFELSSDEALAQNATSVQFSAPVYNYVDNFLSFPVGSAVPVGYYDRGLGRWVASANGQVVQILSVVGNLAQLDVDGKGAPATPAELTAYGISTSELQTLASSFQPGQSFWRVPMTHMTSWDINWRGTGIHPEIPLTIAGSPPRVCTVKKIGSIIDVDKKTLGERIDLPGTPYHLRYSSEEAFGYAARRTENVQLTSSFLDSQLVSTKVIVNIEGQTITTSVPAGINQSVSLNWNGLDAFGRRAQSAKEASVKIQYVIRAPYAYATDVSFPIFGTFYLGFDTSFPTRNFLDFNYLSTNYLGGWTPIGEVGGWTLSEHHFYDSLKQELHLGKGEIVNAGLLPKTISTYVGSNTLTNPIGQEGATGTQTRITSAIASNIGYDGALYYFESTNLITFNNDHSLLRRVDPVTGVITTIAGVLSGGSETAATLDQLKIASPTSIAVNADAIYYSTQTNSGIHIIKNGAVTHILNGSDQTSDNIPAAQASFAFSGSPGQGHGIAVDENGGIYFTDFSRVRYVSPDGIVTTIAGSKSVTAGYQMSNEGGLASKAIVSGATGVTYSVTDGSIFFRESNGSSISYIRKVDKNGIITTVIGGGVIASHNVVSGNLGKDLDLSPSGDLKVGPDNSIYFINNRAIHRMRSDGSIEVIAGSKTGPTSDTESVYLSTQVYLAVSTSSFDLQMLSVTKDGVVYFNEDKYAAGAPSAVNNELHVIRKASSGLPQNGTSGYSIVSNDGNQIYNFSQSGQHLSTNSTLTGAELYHFDYDANGLFIQVTDVNGLHTQIKRDAQGRVQSITSPYGQVTSLAVDSNGYLSNILLPSGDQYKMSYLDSGLMTSFTKPNGATSTFNYDSQGNLAKDQNALNGFLSLLSSTSGQNTSTSATTAESRTSTYQIQADPVSGLYTRTSIDPAGLTSTHTELPNNGSYADTAVDNMSTTSQVAADSRFLGQSYYVSQQVQRSPAGLTTSIGINKANVVSDPSNPLSLVSQTISKTVNAKTSTSVFNATTRTLTLTSAAGRQTQIIVDTKEHPVQMNDPNLSSTQISYDANGRTSQILKGATHLTSYTYDSNGYVNSATNALGHATNYKNDGVGRALTTTLADGRTFQYSYDGNGNLTSVTPSGKNTHILSINLLDLISGYLPPAISGANTPTQYSYNLDKQLTLITRPDGRVVQYNYDPVKGRLNTIATSNGNYSYTYFSTGGHIASILSPDNVMLGFTYDGSLLKSVARTGGTPATVSFNYDNDMRLTSEAVSGGSSISYTYDNDNLPTQIGLEALSYDSQNGLLLGSSISGVISSLGYNTYGEITSDVTKRGTTNVFSLSMTKDALGRVQSKTEVSPSGTNIFAYSYDASERLTDVQKNGVPFSHYDYDSNSNRIAGNVNGAAVTASYDEQDRLVAYGANSYTYNLNGEILTKVTGAQTTNYSYDSVGNLKSVTLPSGKVISYLIDGQNRRIAKSVNGTLQFGYVYSSQTKLIAVTNAAGQILQQYVYGKKSNLPDYIITGSGTYSVSSDQVGSPRVIVNVATGAVAEEITYDEFGNIISDTNPGFQPFGFAGGLLDQDTKLTQFGAREYDPSTGRWISKDPILFNGGDTNLYGYVGTVGKPSLETNLYQYSMSDPINFVDPTGLSASATDGSYPPCAQQANCEQAKNNIRHVASAVGFVMGRCGLPASFAFGLGVRIATSNMCPQTPTDKQICSGSDE